MLGTKRALAPQTPIICTPARTRVAQTYRSTWQTPSVCIQGRSGLSSKVALVPLSHHQSLALRRHDANRLIRSNNRCRGLCGHVAGDETTFRRTRDGRRRRRGSTTGVRRQNVRERQEPRRPARERRHEGHEKGWLVPACVESKFYVAFLLNRRVDLHADSTRRLLDGVAMPVPHRCTRHTG